VVLSGGSEWKYQLLDDIGRKFYYGFLADKETTRHTISFVMDMTKED